MIASQRRNPTILDRDKDSWSLGLCLAIGVTARSSDPISAQCTLQRRSTATASLGKGMACLGMLMTELLELQVSALLQFAPPETRVPLPALASLTLSASNSNGLLSNNYLKST